MIYCCNNLLIYYYYHLLNKSKKVFHIFLNSFYFYRTMEYGIFYLYKITFI